MARTTATLVKQIIETDLEDPVVEGYITAASTLVDEVLAGASLSETLLTEIERWLTAHLIASTRERIAKSEEAGGAKIVYAGEWGQGLYSTSFGQTAIAMDTSGELAAMSGGAKRASLRAIKQSS